MAEREITKNDKPKLDRTNTKPLKYEQSVYLTHRTNAAVEYYFLNRYYRFTAYEKKKMPIEVLEDRNFKKARKYFVVTYIKGVKNG